MDPVHTSSVDDLALVIAARRGSSDAFGELYDRYARMVRAVLLARVPYDEAPDLIQDVFLAAWTELPALRDERAFGAWLARIARNRAHARGRQRVEHMEIADVADRRAPSVEAAELVEIIRSLPAAYAETLLLRFVEGMTGPEIAARTGLTEGSVRVNLHRGMKLLRERIQVRT